MLFDYAKSSIQLALDLINDKLGTGLRQRDVQLKNISYLDEGIYNTQATIVPVDNSGYQGSVDIKYDRININYFFRGISVLINPAYQKLISDLLPSINSLYGLSLNKDDIEDGKLESLTPPFKVTIKIKEDNPAYYGSFVVIITDPSKSLQEIFKEVTIGGIPYPAKDKNKIQGPLYFYASDYTVLRKTLSLYDDLSIADKALLDAFNQIDDVKWMLSKEQQPFNLNGARVLYNGLITENNKYTKRDDFTHVFVLELNDEFCNNISGPLIMHYNLNI